MEACVVGVGERVSAMIPGPKSPVSGAALGRGYNPSLVFVLHSHDTVLSFDSFRVTVFSSGGSGSQPLCPQISSKLDDL